MSNWFVFKGTNKPHEGIRDFVEHKAPPPWRRFYGVVEEPDDLVIDNNLEQRFSKTPFLVEELEKAVINAAIYLRRPLLVTGKPGTGKTSLAYAIAYELKLGKVLTWSITSRSTLQDALYRYDPIGRLQDANLPNQGNDGGSTQTAQLLNIGEFIRLGPLGTALLPGVYPRVLLVDEIDKSDVDLPNDLLHILEEGRYEISELMRLSAKQPNVMVFPADTDRRVTIHEGRVACAAFPIVVLTSNGEREFPPAFLRRCVRLNIPDHSKEKLASIIEAYFNQEDKAESEQRGKLIDEFLARRTRGDLSTDQLLNAIYLLRQGAGEYPSREFLIEAVLQQLSGVSA